MEKRTEAEVTRRLEAARIESALDHAEMRQRTRHDAQRATAANRPARKPPQRDNEYRKPEDTRGTGTTGGVE